MTLDEYDAWIKEEKAQKEKERMEAFKKAGKAPFLVLQEGVTTLTFKNEIPTKRVNNFGKEVADFKVLVGNDEYIFSVNTHSNLYSKILGYIAQGIRTVKIIRAGTGKETRYSVKVEE